MSGIAPDIRQVMRAVLRYVPLDPDRLPDEFFPAHLSVALIDAVYGPRPDGEELPRSIAERYCRHFGLVRTRADRWQPPPVHDQENLRDLIGHYDEFGVGGMAAEVFRTNGRFPGTNIARAEYVLRLATELQRVGVDVLQGMRALRRKDVDAVLRTLAGVDGHIVRILEKATAVDEHEVVLAGVDGHIVRMLLNYAGNDDFVWGDVRVRRFVAFATGRETVSASRAASLVRRAAYELILSPRYLDHQIWRYCDGLPERAAAAR